jgi:hypothetical protein
MERMQLRDVEERVPRPAIVTSAGPEHTERLPHLTALHRKSFRLSFNGANCWLPAAKTQAPRTSGTGTCVQQPALVSLRRMLRRLGEVSALADIMRIDWHTGPASQVYYTM